MNEKFLTNNIVHVVPFTSSVTELRVSIKRGKVV